VGVDVVDVGVIAELGADVDRLEHLSQYLQPYALEAQALR